MPYRGRSGRSASAKLVHMSAISKTRSIGFRLTTSFRDNTHEPTVRASQPPPLRPNVCWTISCRWWMRPPFLVTCLSQNEVASQKITQMSLSLSGAFLPDWLALVPGITAPGGLNGWCQHLELLLLEGSSKRKIHTVVAPFRLSTHRRCDSAENLAVLSCRSAQAGELRFKP
jgi:hypothetical protein